jgi:hypothetical protein
MVAVRSRQVCLARFQGQNALSLGSDDERYFVLAQSAEQADGDRGT